MDYLLGFASGVFVLSLVFYAAWYWRNRRWLMPLHREADGPCCMNAHVFAWIRQQRYP